MKKLTLLLGALAIISGAAYAKEETPTLAVTYVGQSIEVDNTSGGENIGEEVHFGNAIGLEYKDWSFDIFARKTWSMDTEEGIHSAANRIDLDIWKNYENFSLGFRWRQESDLDGYYLRTKYEYGAFSGWIDAAYYSTNGDSEVGDNYYFEAQPFNYTIGPVTLGYYIEVGGLAVNTENDGFKHDYRQQLRASLPIYEGEKLALGFEYRWQFDTDVKYDENKTEGKWAEANHNSHILVLSANYAVTENLSLDGYYQYDMYKFDTKGQGENYIEDREDSGKYYGEFYLGWTYTF